MDDESFASRALSELLRLSAKDDELREVVIDPVAHWVEGPWIHLVYRVDGSPLVFGLARDTSRPEKLSPWRNPTEAASWYLTGDIYGVPYELFEGNLQNIVWLGQSSEHGLPILVNEVVNRHG
ncbi:hypothetical protein OG203_16915 [Nocardia sp. NBC_01499]|uniref:hypothetical protein n=1 Tax=Nocardia sp. NBC_01499 TaxID=2903597 RepID=UPI00386C3E70